MKKTCVKIEECSVCPHVHEPPLDNALYQRLICTRLDKEVKSSSIPDDCPLEDA